MISGWTFTQKTILNPIQIFSRHLPVFLVVKSPIASLLRPGLHPEWHSWGRLPALQGPTGVLCTFRGKKVNKKGKKRWKKRGIGFNHVSSILSILKLWSRFLNTNWELFIAKLDCPIRYLVKCRSWNQQTTADKSNFHDGNIHSLNDEN